MLAISLTTKAVMQMPNYHVWVCLEMEDDVEADSPEEAFIQLSNDAMSGGTWDYRVDEIEEVEGSDDNA